MTFLAKQGSFNVSTAAATNTQQISGVGFQPKIVFFWWSGQTSATDAVADATKQIGFGAAISSSERGCLGSMMWDGASADDACYSLRDDGCIVALVRYEDVEGRMDLQSMDAGGFTLIIDEQFTNAYRVHYLALAGDELTDVEIGSFTKQASTGNQAVSAMADADAALFLMGLGEVTAALNTVNGHGCFSVGGAVSSSARAALVGFDTAYANPTQGAQYAYSGECIATVTGGRSLNYRADFVSFGGSGFTIDWLENTGGQAAQILYILLKGGNYTLGNLLTQTDLVTEIVESGFGYSPAAGLLFSLCQAEHAQNNTTTVDTEISIGGFASATERGAVGAIARDNVATQDCANAVEHDAVYANINSDAIEGLMDIQSVDSGGFTCIMDDADPAQTFVWYLAMGGAAAGGGMLPFNKAIFTGGMDEMTGGLTQ